jgi:hypothetical protein
VQTKYQEKFGYPVPRTAMALKNPMATAQERSGSPSSGEPLLPAKEVSHICAPFRFCEGAPIRVEFLLN